jgi:hypothetical protein
VKRIGSPWPPATCGRVLLNIFLFATTAAGQLALNPSSVSFGSVQIGNSVSQSIVLSNTGSWNLTISQATVSGTGFSVAGLGLPSTLVPGQSVSLSATFAPQSSGSIGGSVSLAYSVPKTKAHGRGSTYSNGVATVSFAGTGTSPAQLTANPSSLSFANVQVGSSQTQSATLTNTGGSALTVSQATLTSSGFSLSGPALPLTLGASQSATFSVVFVPQSAGSVSCNLVFTSNASNPTLTVSLSGTGTARGQLILTPTALDFGSVTVGGNVIRSSSLSASGASVTVSSTALSSAEFSITGISFPLTIAAGQSVPFTLTFAPQTSGAASAALSFASNASNTPTETLSGTGIAPLQHSVSLSWTDAGSGIVGYYVYRASVSGGPYTRITSALNQTVAYNDNVVQAGQTYYYVTTAVDGSGTESAYSNEAQAVIPTP